MHKKTVRRLTLVIAAGIVLVGVALATLAVLGTGPLGNSSTGVLGWIIPIVAGSVIGLAAFLLLDSDQADSGLRVELKAATCSSCGAEVMEEWRMCPDCGEMLDESERAARKNYRPHAIL